MFSTHDILLIGATAVVCIVAFLAFNHYHIAARVRALEQSGGQLAQQKINDVTTQLNNVKADIIKKVDDVKAQADQKHDELKGIIQDIKKV